jgi:UDP-GlcNAc:undecaprenyl-phosphate/decaprenyl-phosphate GlcNAc-1-phosphate transferase
VSAAVTIAAFPVAAGVLWVLLRSRVGGRVVAHPTGERWHDQATPSFGGVGIYLGLLAGLGAAVAAGAVDASSELLGVAAGCTVLFLAGLADDLFDLGPVAKLGAQLGAAAIVLASGLTVEVVESDVLATAIGLVWLVGITNAFNLLDNMDGLAATLAVVACATFAVDAVAKEADSLATVLALSLGLACAAFLPFNLRPKRRAALFMGDSGSQVIGFGLAALALASSWTAAGATLATVLLPLLVLAIPILDTTLVTVRRVLERRPIARGGRDHSSHRLVYYGLSEQQAVAALALLATLLGLTALAYNVLDDARVTAVGVLLSFVVLVQFGSFLTDLEERSARAEPGPPPSLLRALVSQPRRLVEVLIDFAIICASFLAAYLLQVDGRGSEVQRAVFLATLPVLLGVRYVLFVLVGIYRRVWRFATPRDLVAIASATALSAPVTIAIVAKTQSLHSFPLEIFLVDALLCAVLVSASRLALRIVPDVWTSGRRGGERVLVVGAGRSGRSLVRELREASDQRVVGFLDDNPGVRRRHVLGVKVLGRLDEAAMHLETMRPSVVLVTIPDIEPERLDALVAVCATVEIPCRIIRRRTEISRPPLLGVPAE